MKYKVTLAMPVYNVEKYVERALLSALNQTFESIEYLIIDDKGQDGSMNIVRRIVAEHPRARDVRIIDHYVNQGLGATRNTAIKEAQGEFLFFMDSDDYLSKDCVLLLYKASFKNNADITIGSFSECDIKNNILSNVLLTDSCYRGTDAFEKYFFSKYFYVQTWNKLYKLSMLRERKIECIPENINEDIFFTFQLLKSVKAICQISQITYFYTVNGLNSVTFDMRARIMKDKRFTQFVGILNKMEQYIITGGYLKDRSLTYYFLVNKINLVRDVVKAQNLSFKQKREYLKSLPPYYVKYQGAINQQPFYGIMWPYLLLNPFIANIIDSFFILMRKIFHKIKSHKFYKL